MLSISVLGPLVINDGKHGKFPQKARALLAYLACQHGEEVSRDKLADLLWPYQRSEQARHSLRNCLLEVRKGLRQSRAHFSTTFSSCRLVDYQCDLDTLEASANTDGFQGDLYRGPLLANTEINSEPWENWLSAERERVEVLVVHSWRRLGEQALANGDNAGAVKIGNQLVKIDPIYEPGHQLVIAGYIRAGRNSEAIRAYRACEMVLRRDLSVGPSDETRRIIAPDPVLSRRIPNGVPAASPAMPSNYIEADRARMAGYQLAISHLSARYNRLFGDRPLGILEAAEARRSIVFLSGRLQAASEKRKRRLAEADGAEPRTAKLPNRSAMAADW
jgi:DNA-binding SARP family transcriptional activator